MLTFPGMMGPLRAAQELWTHHQSPRACAAPTCQAEETKAADGEDFWDSLVLFLPLVEKNQ